MPISLLRINEYDQGFNERLDRQLAGGFLASNMFLALYYFIFLAYRQHQTNLLCFGVFKLVTFENLPWIIDLPYYWDYTRFWVLVASVVATVNLLPTVCATI